MKKIILVIFLSILLVSLVNARWGYCINSEIADISPSSIGIDEEFTVGIHIESCGTEIPKNIYFEILNPPSDIIINDPLKIDIPKLQYANSERFLTYHMKTAKNANPGKHVIRTRLVYGDDSSSTINYHDIEIDIIGEEAELSIASVKTDPILPFNGDSVELTIRIENYGEGTANSIKVNAEHNFQGSKEGFIGTLKGDEDGPVVFTFIVDKFGEFGIPIKISYEDDFGEHEIDSEIKLIILEKKINWLAIGIGVVFAVFLIWFIIHYFRTKKAKNKIIQELLKENNKKEKMKRKK